jgi:predicted DsbA family dithiol-disulfide isomerase
LPLHEEIPEQGMSLEEFLGDPLLDLPAMMAAFEKTAQENGVAFVPTDRVCNTRLAQELRAWAQARYNRGKRFEKRAFAAYFVEGRNLGQTEVLLDMVRDLGLPVDEAGRVLTDREFQASVDHDLARAEELGIMCAPTFLAHGKRLVGSHPFTVLLDFALGKRGGLGAG